MADNKQQSTLGNQDPSGECETCCKAKKTSISAIILKDLIASAKSSKQKRDKDVKIFLESMNALYNNGGGIVCIHTSEPYLLNKYDEQVDNILLDMITDGTEFADNFERYFHYDKFHVVFRVKPVKKPISTLYLNLKTPLDVGIKNPTQAQLIHIVNNVSKSQGNEDNGKTIVKYTYKMNEEPTAQLQSPTSDSDIKLFMENQKMQAKATIQISENTVVENVMQKLPQYVSAFHRKGGRVFYGVVEELREAEKKQWKKADAHDYSHIFTMQSQTPHEPQNQVAEPEPAYQVWTENEKPIFHVAKEIDAPTAKMGKQLTGRFLCTGIALPPSARSTVCEKIRTKLRHEMMWISFTPEKVKFPVDVRCEVVQDAEDRCVLEIIVSRFHGLCFFDRDGPQAFRYVENSVKKVDFPTWVSEMVHDDGCELNYMPFLEE